MNAEEPKTSDSETSHSATLPRRKRFQVRTATKWELGLFAGFAILVGGGMSLVALLRVIETLQGNPPKNDGWSLELGLVIASFGVVAVVAGVAMWRRRQWGWWLMAGLLFVVSLVASNGGIIQLGFILIALWALRPLFGFPGRFHTLEPDIDQIAKNLGIDWTATPLARISEMLAANKDIEATRL